MSPSGDMTPKAGLGPRSRIRQHYRREPVQVQAALHLPRDAWCRAWFRATVRRLGEALRRVEVGRRRAVSEAGTQDAGSASDVPAKSSKRRARS